MSYLDRSLTFLHCVTLLTFNIISTLVHADKPGYIPILFVCIMPSCGIGISITNLHIIFWHFKFVIISYMNNFCQLGLSDVTNAVSLSPDSVIILYVFGKWGWTELLVNGCNNCNHLQPVQFGRPHQQLCYRWHSSHDHLIMQAPSLHQSRDTFRGKNRILGQWN